MNCNTILMFFRVRFYTDYEFIFLKAYKYSKMQPFFSQMEQFQYLILHGNWKDCVYAFVGVVDKD